MPDQHDAIVIGSGFGGAVAACRLSEAGFSTLVLERGRRWDKDSFPRKPEDPWLWDQAHPERRHGWIDLRVFPRMAVVQGSGVGGGSLIYANVCVDAQPDSFDEGWPPEVTYGVLQPHYRTVRDMLQARPVPKEQWPKRTRLLKDAAEATGNGDRFQPLDLAVSFDENWSYDLPDRHAPSRSREFVNAQGRKQGTCVHLGNCDIGCDVGARNTLDLNYLARAEDKGAEVRPLHLVRGIEPRNGGYRVWFDRIDGETLVPGEATARIVMVAAGSLGSTELLLRCRDQHRTLPSLTSALGSHWSSNGDFLTPALHPTRRVRPTRGPTITAAVNFLDGAREGQRFFIEDGGFPDVLDDYLQRLSREDADHPALQALIRTLRYFLSTADTTAHVMPWFAQGRDAADGVLSLAGGHLFLKWDPENSAPLVNAIVRTHELFARKTHGFALVPLTWTLARQLITPHPLGGCVMGTSPANGVVDHKGEVFGYRNLFVTDGAIVPKAIGLNPSKTIAALAEHVAASIVEGRR